MAKERRDDKRRRKQIQPLVAGNPGVGLRELARLAGVDPSTIENQIPQLIDAGAIVDRRTGQHRRFFIDQATANTYQEPRPPVREGILAVLREHGNMTQKNLRDALPGVAKATVQHHVRKLVAERLVAQSREGRFVAYIIQ